MSTAASRPVCTTRACSGSEPIPYLGRRRPPPPVRQLLHMFFTTLKRIHIYLYLLAPTMHPLTIVTSVCALVHLSLTLGYCHCCPPLCSRDSNVTVQRHLDCIQLSTTPPTMDEEESFARLLSASTPAPRPTLFPSGSAGADQDPWANPFGATSGSGAGGGAGGAFGNTMDDAWGASTIPSIPADPNPAATATSPAAGQRERSPSPAFGGAAGDERPDPPSVIAARERQELAAATGGGGGFGGSSSAGWGAFDDPYSSTTAGWSPPPKATFGPQSPTSPTRSNRGAHSRQTSGAASQLGSPTSPKTAAAGASRALPAGLIDEELLAEHDPRASLTRAFVKSAPVAAPPASGPVAPQAHPTPEKKVYVFKPRAAVQHEIEREKPAAVRSSDPTAVPLPESAAVTPATSRPATPAVSSPPASSTLAPESVEHLSVSPLDTPATETDFGFRSLAIGGSGALAASNGSPGAAATRFGGRGWGAVDAEETPLSGDADGADPWNEGGSGGGGWGEPAVAAPAPMVDTDVATESEQVDDAPTPSPSQMSPSASSSRGSPRRSKLLSTPLFQISVSDPTKVGDPVRGHVVYTVRTKTTSPHYRRGEFSVLRRFSDFLWLYESLTSNNPGVIVPPVPDKHAFGRFQDQFIETRRVALQRCLTKITAHPILQLDPDLRLFLESDTFALDVKNRRMTPAEGTTSSGFMSSWTGPRYIETDEWFDQRKLYLDHLEGQLKGLSKSLDIASKARLDMATSMGEFADTAAVLAESDLGAAMCAALGRLADLARRERTTGEDQAKADVGQLLNLAEEYVRFIASVRLAFASRVRAYHAAQAADKEVQRLRKQREKDRVSGKPPASTMHELGEVRF